MDTLPFLYKTSLGRILLKPLTAPSISRLCGRFLDSKLSAFLIKGFIRKNDIAIEDYQTEGIKTFNQFFRRKIKDGLRPFDMTPSKLCAPCDGLLSVWNIEEVDGTIIPVKQSQYTVESLLQNKELAAQYKGGLCLVFRLCVNHYHRYAYVDSGKKGTNTFIPGILHTVRPIALETLPVFVQNSREYTVIESSVFGALVQMEVGAMLVGRIVNHEEEAVVSRGAEKGFFEYGGSTIILLIEKDKIKMRKEIIENSLRSIETPVIMGEVIGSSETAE